MSSTVGGDTTGGGLFWKPASTPADDITGGGVYCHNYNDVRNEEDVAVRTYSYSTRTTAAPLAHQRRLLPIFQHQRQILYAVEHFPVVVIVGETGSGKTKST